MRYLPLVVLLIGLPWAVLPFIGCSSLKVESSCVYERTVTTSYQCEPGGSLEHIRVAPGASPEP